MIASPRVCRYFLADDDGLWPPERRLYRSRYLRRAAGDPGWALSRFHTAPMRLGLMADLHLPSASSTLVGSESVITVMDIVFIEELRIDAVIGIYDWERRVRQTLSFDIEMAFDNTLPAASDDIALTLNYKDVSKRLIDYVGASSFGLVETLAERCAAIIREEFGVAWVRLKLSKPGAVRGAKAVGVRIERGVRPQ